jgi:two-component system, NtrC family, sensor kinase
MTARVLIVDDSLTVRMDLADAFSAAGFTALPCATLGEARAVLAAEPVDVLVLDVMLPDGDGVELLREVRAAADTGPAVLMLSAEAEVSDRIRGIQTGADEYVGKPYDVSYVVARARELVRVRVSPVPRGPTVLIIDDSPTARDVVRRALEQGGYDVLEAASGEEGLRVAASLRPDAVIVDFMLPGIDGGAVIRSLRLDAAMRSIPCLLLTAETDRGTELRALDAGADAFLRKEDDADLLLARLSATMRRAEGTAGRESASLLGPRKILAIDDSNTYLQSLASALHGEGYDVVLARSGEEALELLAVQSVDCILLDLLMPGIGGHETCRRIKSAPVVRDIPLIMLTAVDDRAAMLDGLAVGADDYIAKSSELDVLRARVRAQIRRKQFEDENRHIREELLRAELEAAEARAARELAEARQILVDELEWKNAELQFKNDELESFSYSVSHDLRAPLRSIDGFSQVFLEDYGDALDDRGRDYLLRVRAAAHRMGTLIDDLLQLSRVGRAELRRERVDLSAVARQTVAELQRLDTDRAVELVLADRVTAVGDPHLLRIVLDNLLGNAWKFTSKAVAPRIEFGVTREHGLPSYYVRDNGAGFDSAYAERLFKPFQRLHSTSEFPGTGIGLAIIQRIVSRHGGRCRAEGVQGEGATFSFTLPDASGSRV